MQKENAYKEWMEGTAVESSDSCSLDAWFWSESCSCTYKNELVSDEYIGKSESTVYQFLTKGSVVMEMKFNTIGRTMVNWFDKSTIISASNGDVNEIKSQHFIFFSVIG